MKKYKTKSGDTFDKIALSQYGSERALSFLMENNKRLTEYLVLPEGIEVIIEDLPESEELLPDWRLE